MKWIRLTGSSFLAFALFLLFSSCEKDAETKKVYAYSKTNIPMTGAQVTPAVNPSPTAATGNLTVSYDKRTRILNYTFTWAGLTSVPIAVGIYGPAPVGYAALTSTGLAPALQSLSVSGLKIDGSITGALTVENVKIKEDELLDDLFYVQISSASYPTGEIRAQVKFQ
jgi:hypothetical protein